MKITVKEFATYVNSWAGARGSDFKYYLPLKGGWEAWTQADLAAYILSKDSTVDILREQMIYQGQQKVDWLINNGDPTKADRIAVELKCQSFENQSGFVKGLDNDEKKLDQNNLNSNYKGCQTIVMGIAFESNAFEWMKKNGYTTATYDNGEVAIGLKQLN